MKKFLFGLMGLVVALPAWTADESCECIKKLDDLKTDHILVSFETNKVEVCDCAKAEIENFLKSLPDIENVLLFGSADATGNGAANRSLAERRVLEVKKILPADVPYSIWSGGDSDALWDTGEKRTPNSLYRSVLIIPVQKHVSEICNMEAITTIIQKFPTRTVKLRQACDDKTLDNAKIVEILKELIEQEPEIKAVVLESGVTLGVLELYSALVDETKDIRSERSVWRTAEGKFNTARLASDSIAGVVLGTVGGVVTSNLIKKSQVKQGFEDIKCAIGGQTVASYGDEFSVGLQ